MKELTIEEKAKRYDEAIEKAKYYYDEGKTLGYADDIASGIFPELKESEDERIRKSLIGHLKECRNNTRSEVMLGEYAKWIAWIEKQGKNNMGISEATKKELEDKLHKALEKETPESLNKFLDEQGEQNPADKIKPRFKVGDWITNGIDATFQIRSIEDNMYLRSDDYFIDIETADKKFRFWTIQDAKDGDVLYENDTKTILIFKSQTCGWIKVYCDFWINKNKFTGTDLADYGRVSEMNLKPATKEQRELLFQKMKEAGYEWDAEKKELKKIEQNPANEVGNYDHKKVLQTIINEQKPAWSEEDETIVKALTKAANDNVLYGYTGKSKLLEWLKSLKDRYTWKPSEEQMEALDSAIHCYAGISPTNNREVYALEIMKEQLKKLREE